MIGNGAEIDAMCINIDVVIIIRPYIYFACYRITLMLNERNQSLKTTCYMINLWEIARIGKF